MKRFLLIDGPCEDGDDVSEGIGEDFFYKKITALKYIEYFHVEPVIFIFDKIPLIDWFALH